MSVRYEEYQVERFERDAYNGAMAEAGKEWERQRNETEFREGNLEARIAELEGRLAARDALIERLVEAGQRLADETESYDDIMAWELVNDEAQRLTKHAGDKLAEGE